MVGFSQMFAWCHYCPDEVVKDQLIKKQKQKKFKGADILIRDLAYIMKLDPERKFTVMYKDRFKGLMECDIQKFLETSDIPYHRIQFFKENGEVCWDRA